MRTTGDVEDLLKMVKSAFPPRVPDIESRSREIAQNITVQGDALIASEVTIGTLQTRVTNQMQAEAISLAQAVELSSRAQGLANDGETEDQILTWVAGKFGVPGYLSIPANGFEAAMTYLDAKDGEQIRSSINVCNMG